MSKLKLKSLLEGYAWERNADGSLPTLKDAIATHAANVAEQAELNMPGMSDDETEVDETAKPDYIDLDGDGDETETMKHAAHDKEMHAEGEHAYKNSTNNELASHMGQLKTAMKDGKLSAKEIKLLQQDLEEMQAELKNRKQNEGLTQRDLNLIAKFKKNLNESARRY